MPRTRARVVRTVPDHTRARILDAAERLFAERGVDAVSVRTVLKEAGVNVALAHYHFGSREGLIRELLLERAAPVAAEALRRIEEVVGNGPGASLEDVLRAFFDAVTRALAARPVSARLFAQLQLSSNEAIRTMGEEVTARMLRRLAEALASRVPPGIPPERLLLRFYMIASLPSFFGSHWERVLVSARRRLPPKRNPTLELLRDELVAFCAAGLRCGAEAGRDEKG